MVTNNSINTNIPIQEIKGGTGQSTYTTGDILYSSASNTLSKLPIGNFGSALNVNSTNIVWSSPNITQTIYDDFLHFEIGDWSFNNVGSGTIGRNTSAVDNHPGIWSLFTGSDTTGAANNHLMEKSLLLSSGQILIEWVINLPVLSNGTDRYTFRAGALDDFQPTDGINAVMFRYVDNVNSGNWVLVTRNGGSETTVNTTTAVSTSWTRLSIIIVPVTPIATFYINGVSVGTIATNIPLTNPVGIQSNIVKSAGSTNTAALLDYAYIYNQLASAR